MQPRGRFRSNRFDSDVANHAKGCDRFHETHSSTGGGFLDDHVAGKQQTNAWLGPKRTVGKLRIAGAQDLVRPEVFLQLFLQGRSNIDLRQDAKPSSFKSSRVRRSASWKLTGMSTVNSYPGLLMFFSG